MAGFFGFFDYSKPGPGVDVNAPPKGPVRNYFALLFRKFWTYVGLNIFYVLANIPAIILAFFLSDHIFRLVFPNTGVEGLERMVQSLAQNGLGRDSALQFISMNRLFIVMMIMAVLIGSALVTVGPFQAGFSYIFRNYAREEHAFIFSDFREHSAKNWKQGLIHSLLTLLLVALFPIAIYVYRNLFGGQMWGALLNAVIVLSAVLVYMAQFFIYQMMLTFDLPLRHIYRNALLLVMAKLPFCLLLSLLSLLILVGLPLLFYLFLPAYFLPFTLFYEFFFAFSWNALLVNDFANRQFQRYMLPKTEAERSDGAGERGPDAGDPNGDGDTNSDEKI